MTQHQTVAPLVLLPATDSRGALTLHRLLAVKPKLEQSLIDLSVFLQEIE